MKFSSQSALTTLAAAAALSLSLGAQANPAMVDANLKNPELHYAASQLLVQFRPGQAAALRDAALSHLGAKSIKVLRSAQQRTDGGGDLHLVSLPGKLKVSDAIRRLRQSDIVDFAEPNWIYKTQAKAVDPYYADGSLWGIYGDNSPLQTNVYGSQAGEAFAAGKKCKASVIVGIIDEGMMPNHPDTQANVWSNPFEIPNNGIDDDGNGYIDDVSGWDFVNKDNTPFDGVGDDHATHVSGTIGATANNGIGVAGVCPSVKMISAKFLGSSGGTTADGILAIDYITDLKTRHGLNIVATNNSWGGGGFSQAMQDAIERANQANILFIAAAGNGNILGIAQNNDKKPNYPSNYPNDNVIAVAAITKTGAKSSFSNYGLTTVDIGAPGSDIWSTVPKKSGDSVIAGYASYDGTSMATPHVTGAAALYASLHPGSTAAQIKAAILNSAVPTPSLAGKTVTGGRLDVSGF